MNTRKLKSVRVDMIVLERMLKRNGQYVVDSSIPEDAILRGSYFDWEKDAIFLTFQHESFDEIPLGERVPEMDNPIIYDIS